MLHLSHVLTFNYSVFTWTEDFEPKIGGGPNYDTYSPNFISPLIYHSCDLPPTPTSPSLTVFNNHSSVCCTLASCSNNTSCCYIPLTFLLHDEMLMGCFCSVTVLHRYKLWHFCGSMIHQRDTPPKQELWEVRCMCLGLDVLIFRLDAV